MQPGNECSIHGPANVSSALSSSTDPATCRAAGRDANPCNRCAPQAAMNSAGAVPSPKAAIVNAPRAASSCSVAISSTEYTKPQGIQPHTMPNANAARQRLHRQQAPAERRELRPEPAPDADAGIAHAAEGDQRA